MKIRSTNRKLSLCILVAAVAATTPLLSGCTTTLPASKRTNSKRTRVPPKIYGLGIVSLNGKKVSATQKWHSLKSRQEYHCRKLRKELASETTCHSLFQR